MEFVSILNLRLDGRRAAEVRHIQISYAENALIYDQGCTSIRVGINGPREPARSQTQGDARIKCRVSAAPLVTTCLGERPPEISAI